MTFLAFYRIQLSFKKGLLSTVVQPKYSQFTAKVFDPLKMRRGDMWQLEITLTIREHNAKVIIEFLPLILKYDRHFAVFVFFVLLDDDFSFISLIM